MATVTKGNRVELHTSEASLEKIRDQTIANIKHYSSNQALLNDRIKQLDEEWDIERYLETNASIVAFLGLVLGVFVNFYWLILSALVLMFLFQHAIQGWCPPLPIFRKFGKRTKREIEIEKYALKALRGDFKPTNVAMTAYSEANQM